MSTGEKLVLAVFALAALSWVFVPVVFDTPPISDAGIAMVVGLLLFLLPAGAERGVRPLEWAWLRRARSCCRSPPRPTPSRSAPAT